MNTPNAVGTSPSLAEFLRLAQRFSMVPVCRELLADGNTPVAAFREVGHGDGAVLLESVNIGERWGRFSFIGLEPLATLTVAGDQVHWAGARPAGLPDGPLIPLLRALLGRLCAPRLPGLPPLFAGAIGFLGGDALRRSRPTYHQSDGRAALDAALTLPRSMIAFDHFRQTLTVVVNVLTGVTSTDLEERYAAALERIDELVALLAMPRRAEPIPFPSAQQPVRLSSDTPSGEYRAMVLAARDEVRQGRVHQVVPSRRFSVQTDADPFDVYRVLRVLNPSPYMYFLRLPGTTIVGSSPQMLVKVKDGVVTSGAIGGTRPRGLDDADDRRLEEELVGDSKELHEHELLVELALDDLRRVARPTTVQLTRHADTVRYSHVMHLVSEASGELATGRSTLDALLACFPAGTVSGTPRAAAMAVLDRLERRGRGVYGGSIGYFDFSGNLDMCIAIRTLEFRQGTASCQVGAGVVADSSPERETRETEAKARGLFTAIMAAEKLWSRRDVG
jgi:anthranilate synthase component I